MISDIVRRAKKLAEMEEGERPDCLECIADELEAAKDWCDCGAEVGQ